jgi:tRNA(Ile)-lysidine synthetase-like protein
MQRHALKQFLEWHGIKVDFHHVEEVRKCAVGAIPSASLPGSWQAERNGDWLELTPPPVQTPEPSPGGYMYCVRISGHCVIPEASLTIQATILPAEAAAQEPPGTLLRAAVIDPELTFRNWLPGDRFRPAHSASEEKLKRLFSKRHIPADQRPLWPVALSGSRIVWVREFPVAHDFAWLPGSGDALKIEVLDAI